MKEGFSDKHLKLQVDSGVGRISVSDLTPFEESVILKKGTEPPYIGKYTDHFAAGLYHCRKCGAALFSSESKFHSGCGWPSFDKALPGTVREVPDADGTRTEIVCASCGGHLGHVFRGERFTPENTRHCVNSVSMVFAPGVACDHRGEPGRKKQEILGKGKNDQETLSQKKIGQEGGDNEI